MILLVVALGIGVVLAVINAGLLVWAAFGLLLAFAPEVIRAATRELRAVGQRLRPPGEGGWSPKGLAAAGASLLLGVVALFGTIMAVQTDDGPVFDSARASIVLDADFRAEATVREDPDRLEVGDRLSIKQETLEEAAKAASKQPETYKRREPPPNGNFQKALEQDLERGMTSAGWTASAPSTSGFAFTREREQPIGIPRFRAQGTTTLEVPHPLIETQPTSNYFLDLPPTTTSKLLVTAEKGAIAATFPKGETQSQLVDDDLATTIVPMPDTGDQVELTVRRQLFREQPFARVADVTFSKLGIGLVVLLFSLVGAIAKDELKALLKRLLDRVLKRQPPAPPPANGDCYMRL